ncbi:MAG: hypothetical protein ACYTGH_03320 [Planctomycetota bacterium]
MRAATVLALSLTLSLLTGCSSFYKQGTFHQCTNAQCALCKGTQFKTCLTCRGTGQKPCTKCNGLKKITCKQCNGLGQKAGLVCDKCNGQRTFTCTACGNTGSVGCSTCKSVGKTPCGNTTYAWICRKCGRNFTYPPKGCPDCDRKKK